MTCVKFGEFRLNLSRSELMRGRSLVPLQDKPLELLKALVEHPGELVSRETLKARLWGDDTFVDFDNNLNAAVKKLRDALGDSAERPRYVQTVPRRGYCFVGKLEREREHELESRPRRRIGRLPVAFVAALLLCGLATGAYWRLAPHDRSRLVVLPFQNLSTHDGDELLVDGVSEEVSTHLGRLSPARLGVIAHSSTLASSAPERLGVDYLVEGSFRSEGDVLRVTARLVQLGDRTQVWSETYELERNDAFRIPQTVAVSVARAMAIELLGSDIEVLARAGTTNGTAYAAYLRGRRELRTFSAEGYREAAAAFEEANAIDPDYALAHVGLAEVFHAAGRPDDAKREAVRAIAIEPRLAEAHAALGQTLLYFDRDRERASRALKRALELHPGLSQAHHGYAAVLASSGRLDEAITEVKRGLELDPLSQPLRGDLGFYYLAAERFQDALQECRGLLDASPIWARECLTQAYAAEGRFQDAVGAFRETFPHGASGVSIAATAREELARLRRLRLEETLEHVPRDQICPLKVASEYGALGDSERVLEWLDRAIDERVPGLVFVNVDPAFEGMREDPRFERLTARLRANTSTTDIH